jgi:hypothetical protein
MSGSAGLSQQKKRKREIYGSSKVVPTLKTESADLVAGPAAHIVDRQFDWLWDKKYLERFDRTAGVFLR